MKRLTYAARMTGSAGKVSDHLNMWKAHLSSSSVSITSTAGPDGLTSEIAPVPGGQITFDSEAFFVADETIIESGVVTFGDGKHKLRFSTVGEGFLRPTADPKVQHGCIIWRVDGGEGQFEGASGYITSNFVADESGEVADYHFGVIWIT